MYIGDVDAGRVKWQLAKADADLGEADLASADSRDGDYVRTADGQVPWENAAGKYGVALNGKTLAFLANHRDEYELVLQKVLHEAAVYARMSPDDKATLVELLL